MSHERKREAQKRAPLFRVAPEIERRVRRTLGDVMKRSGKTRREIEARMASTLGVKVTLGKFTRNATKKNNSRFPLAWLPAFCEAVGDWSLLSDILPEDMKPAFDTREEIQRAKRALARAHAALEALEGQSREEKNSVRRSRTPRKRRAAPNSHSGGNRHGA